MNLRSCSRMIPVASSSTSIEEIRHEIFEIFIELLEICPIMQSEVRIEPVQWRG
jgi:hypothetical protein